MNKVVIGTITGDFIRTKTVHMLITLIKTNQHVAQFIIQQGPYIHLNRDYVVLEAQKSDYTHLFFVDNDVCFAPASLDRLLAHDKDIVGAPYNMRTLPPQTMIKMMDEDGNMKGGSIADLPKELFKCYALGTGCMLIKMDVFKKISRPWFFYGKFDEDEGGMGEDVFFCKKAHEIGYDVWCDPTISVGHIGETIF